MHIDCPRQIYWNFFVGKAISTDCRKIRGFIDKHWGINYELCMVVLILAAVRKVHPPNKKQFFVFEAKEFLQ